MPWFGRKKQQPAPSVPSPSDPDLAPLDVEQAATLRRLVRDDLARRGLEGEIFAAHVEAGGHRYGLTNLARKAAAHDPRDWPTLIATHLDPMFERDDLDDLTDAELLDRVYARLMSDGPELREMFPDAFAPAPGLLLVLCIDYPTKVRMVAQSFYEARGGADRWWSAGFDNLRELVESDELTWYPVGRDGLAPRFDIVAGDSAYVASLAAVLPELLAHDSQCDLGRGLLLAVPDRGTIVFRVVDGAEALPAIGEIARVAAGGYDRSAGPLSPHVYLVNRRGWHQLTEIDGDTTRVMLGEEAAIAFDLHDQG